MEWNGGRDIKSYKKGLSVAKPLHFQPYMRNMKGLDKRELKWADHYGSFPIFLRLLLSPTSKGKG